jgi:putative PIN family toxin of toxin-antitoxin system
LRVFLDTNVLVSAFAARGLCADLFELVLLEHELVVGAAVLRELDKALRKKVRLSPPRAKEIVDFVRSQAAHVARNASLAPLPVDPDDALVLGEAHEAQAEVFVTGDAKLLALGAFDALRILSPRQFWEVLRQPGT